MRQYEADHKAKEKYRDCRLYYKIVSEGRYTDQNERNLEKMKEALYAVGIWLDVSDGELSLSIYPEGYIRTRGRNAGRRKKAAFTGKKEQLTLTNGHTIFIDGRYKYSDIVLMMQTMKDQEIYEKIGMKSATFYRHKKSMKETEYYKSLDLNRLRDKEYLESVSGNYSF